MAKYTLEDIMYGNKYGIESAVFAETFRMAQQGVKAKEIREQLNICSMSSIHCLQQRKCTMRAIVFRITKLQSPFNM